MTTSGEAASAAQDRDAGHRRRPGLGWFTEFFAIVFGILVALGGDAWWDGRVERREEHEALAALRSEFSTSLRALQTGVRVHERSAQAIRQLLEWTGPQPKLPDDTTLSRELYDAVVTYSTYNDRRGVLDGVIASGALRLIQNDSLRARLAGWPAVVEDLTEDEILALELRNRELLPYVYRRVPVDGSEFPRDYRALFADPYFERLLDWRYRQLNEPIRSAYYVAIGDLESMLAEIDRELGITGGGASGDSLR